MKRWDKKIRDAQPTTKTRPDPKQGVLQMKNFTAGGDRRRSITGAPSAGTSARSCLWPVQDTMAHGAHVPLPSTCGHPEGYRACFPRETEFRGSVHSGWAELTGHEHSAHSQPSLVLLVSFLLSQLLRFYLLPASGQVFGVGTRSTPEVFSNCCPSQTPVF